jgi:hypothetical protein
LLPYGGCGVRLGAAMRALIEVALQPDSGSSDYPSDDDLRRALRGIGLEPAGYAEQAQKAGPHIPDQHDFVKRPWLNTQIAHDPSVPRTTLTDEERPPIMEPPNVWVPNAHQSWGLTELFRSLGLPIFQRMPSGTRDDINKLEEAWRHLIFASDLTATGTRFIVTRETNGWVRFRLHNPLIERLQRGCEDLVELLEQGRIGELEDSTTARSEEELVQKVFRTPKEINIYEHGQEDATIIGRVIGKSLRRRARYFARIHRASILTFFVLLALLALMIIFEVADIPSSHKGLQDWRDRLATGLVPVLLVTAISLEAARKRRPHGNVAWSHRYPADHPGEEVSS